MYLRYQIFVMNLLLNRFTALFSVFFFRFIILINETNCVFEILEHKAVLGLGLVSSFVTIVQCIRPSKAQIDLGEAEVLFVPVNDRLGELNTTLVKTGDMLSIQHKENLLVIQKLYEDIQRNRLKSDDTVPADIFRMMLAERRDMDKEKSSHVEFLTEQVSRLWNEKNSTSTKLDAATTKLDILTKYIDDIMRLNPNLIVPGSSQNTEGELSPPAIQDRDSSHDITAGFTFTQTEASGELGLVGLVSTHF